MSETAKHETLDNDHSSGVLDKLTTLELETLSFIQLRRLRNALMQVSRDVEKELDRRGEEDNSGDTVRVPSPRI
jgi:hypothetical protein